MSAAGLSIVIPSWNGRPLLERFLPTVLESARAFEAACGQPAEILVADDASTDDTAAWLRARWPKVRFDSAMRQQGFAPTANRGARVARFSLLYLVNNDVAMAPTTLPPLAAHFRDPKVFAASGNAYDFASGVLARRGTARQISPRLSQRALAILCSVASRWHGAAGDHFCQWRLVFIRQG